MDGNFHIRCILSIPFLCRLDLLLCILFPNLRPPPPHLENCRQSTSKRIRQTPHFAPVLCRRRRQSINFVLNPTAAAERYTQIHVNS